MRMVDLINKKKNGGILDREELAFFVNGVTDGSARFPWTNTPRAVWAIKRR